MSIEKRLKKLEEKFPKKTGRFPTINLKAYLLELSFFEIMHIEACYNYAINKGWDENYETWDKYLDDDFELWPFSPPGPARDRIIQKVADPEGPELNGIFIIRATGWRLTAQEGLKVETNFERLLKW